MNKRKTGAEREEQAAKYLTEHGMRIVERNYRNRQGEIDIIGYHENFLVFVEVKYRNTYDKGSALSAVTAHKQMQICKVADFYRYQHKLGERTAVRYDVVAIQGKEVIWIKNAFPHIYVRG
ncbi:MAG: YraN family protein [Lachnospiraceae bacterium]|nr:YraN family protein [Lachnospiraceae bacterium]